MGHGSRAHWHCRNGCNQDSSAPSRDQRSASMPSDSAALSPRLTTMTLRRYLLRRLGLAVVTLFGVIVAVFFITRILPGDPVSVKAGAYATDEVRAAITKELGLDKPLPQQLATYLGNILQGNLGTSTRSGQPVRQDLLS